VELRNIYQKREAQQWVPCSNVGEKMNYSCHFGIDAFRRKGKISEIIRVFAKRFYYFFMSKDE
jgi:hypothetical protein